MRREERKKAERWMESRGEKGVERITDGKEGDRVGMQDRGKEKERRGGKRE